MNVQQKADLLKFVLFISSAALFATGLIGCEKRHTEKEPTAAASTPMKKTPHEMPGARPIQAASVPSAPSIDDLKKNSEQ